MTETAAHLPERMPAGRDVSPAIGEVVTALPLDRTVVVRLAHTITGYPEQVALHSTHLVPYSDAYDVRTPVVGEPCTLSSDHLEFGGWTVDRTSVTLGGTCESALLTMPLEAPNPSDDPDAGRVLASLFSDAVTVSKDTSQTTDLTTSPLTDPTLRISLRCELGEQTSSCCELFVVDGVAIEWLRFDEGSRPVVSRFRAGDLPLRLLERCGLGRRASIGRPAWRDQEVDIRCTHLSSAGLMLESLAWTESHTGTVSTSDGPATPMGLASQVLGLLPGGDLRDERSEGPDKALLGSATTDTPGGMTSRSIDDADQPHGDRTT